MKSTSVELKSLNYILWILLVIILSSCNENTLEVKDAKIQRVDSIGYDNLNFSLKQEFAKAFAKVIAHSQEVRQFIKEEALRKIDYDYDVLYSLIRHQKIYDGRTIENMLTEYISFDKLALIESRMPTLTIFVPKLPMNSFSAEKWNPCDEIPVVGIRTNLSNEVLYYDGLGKEDKIEATEIPGFPIVVIKDNERIYSKTSASERSSLIVPSEDNNVTLEFINDNFNNLKSQGVNLNPKVVKTVKRGSLSIKIPDELEKVYQSYDIYEHKDGWQRDYIYYNIAPDHPKGPFNYDMKEYIVSFEMLGDPYGVFDKISDQEADPKLDGNLHRKDIPGRKGYHYGCWTDGEFEFKVKVYWGAKNSIGTEYITYFRANPDDLFHINYKETKKGKKYKVQSIKFKTLDLSLPLFEWNLENYSSSIKIAIEEVDAVETVKQTIENYVDFATNFGFDVNWGQTVKTGIKFGASQKQSLKVTNEITTTLGNDELGEVIVNFGDDIILSRNDMFEGTIRHQIIVPDYNNKYSTGWYRIHIAPLDSRYVKPFVSPR
ncbi:hypothetical protein [Phocaeicola sp.]